MSRKNFITFILLLVALSSCKDIEILNDELTDKRMDSILLYEADSVTAAENEIKDIQRLLKVDNLPFIIPNSDYALVPIGNYQKAKSFGNVSGNYILGYPVQRTQNHGCDHNFKGRFENFIFYTLETEEFYILSKESLPFQAFYVYIPKTGFAQEPLIFYEVKDGVDNYELHVSDKTGRLLSNLTPPDHTMLDWQYFPHRNAVLLMLSKDENGNNAHDSDEKLLSQEISLVNFTNGMVMRKNL